MPEIAPTVTNFNMTCVPGAATNISVTLSNNWQVVNLRLIQIRLRKRRIDVIQHGTENDVYADFSSAQWREGLHPPYTYRPYTAQEAVAIRYAWARISEKEKDVTSNAIFYATLCVAASVIGIAAIYCVDPWIIKLVIDGVYLRDRVFIDDAVGRFIDNFSMIFFLWICYCFAIVWMLTHLPISKKPFQ